MSLFITDKNLQDKSYIDMIDARPFPRNPFAFLWLYVLKNKKIFFGISLCAVLSVLLNKLAPYLFSKLVALFGQDVAFTDISSKVWLILILIVVASLLSKVFGMMSYLLTEIRFQTKVYKQISLDCFAYINGHSVAYFADNMAGALAQKSKQLADNASFYTALLYYLSDVFQLLVIFGMLTMVNLGFALFFALCIVISVFVLAKIGKLSVNLREQMVESRNYASGQMIDALQNNFFVRLFNGFTHERKRASGLLQSENNATNRSVNMEYMQSQGEKLYFQAIYLSFLLYLFYLWKVQSITAADVVLAFFLLQNVADTVSFLIHRGIIYSGVFTEMRTNLIPFTMPHDIKDLHNAPEIKVKEGKIEFKNVDFSYPQSKTLFKNLNITIPAGQKVGIVGMSGGGKSTLINLLQRFYDIQSGEIVIDGQNLQKVTQESLHHAISYVPQTSCLLERSIKENIAYGRPNASMKEIENAAKEAYAYEFIKELPHGYQTLLNAQNQLSGGQMQRISIARALLKNAPILILDEATSALDSESEFYIQKAIENMLQNKTVIAVAHRLSTLKNMDRIIVLEKGKVVEDGKPDELLKKKGKFYQYWNLQKLKGEKHEK